MNGVGRLLASVSLPRFAEHPLRTGLTILGIGLGVAVLVAVVLVQRSILGSVRDTIDDISGKADWQVSAGSQGIDEGLLDKVEGTTGVYKVTPVIQQSVRIATSDMDKSRAEALAGQTLVVIGAEFLDQDDEYFRPYGSHDIEAIREDPIAFLNSRTNILLSKKFADTYGLKERDVIPLVTPLGKQAFTIWGFIPEDRIGRSVGGALGVMYYQAMQASFGRGDKVDRFDVAVTPGGDAEGVGRALSVALGPGFNVERPERRAGRIEHMLAGFSYALTGGSLIALLVGLFLIFNTVAISVVQRKTEIGILRALGTTRSQILWLFACEGLVLGAAGALLGTLIGLWLARGLLVATTKSLSEIYMRIRADTVVLDGWLIAAAVLLGLAGTLLSAWRPARDASRVTPIETIRAVGMSAKVRKARSRALDLLGAAMLALGGILTMLPPLDGRPVFGLVACFLLPMGIALLMPRILPLVQAALRPWIAWVFGLEGQLANENVSRDIPRASVTAAALSIAMGMVLCFAVYVHSFQSSMLRWVDQSVPADLFVTHASRFSGGLNVPMPESLGPIFDALPGVKSADRVRIADLDFKDRTIKILSVDWRIYSAHALPIFLQGDLETTTKHLLAGTGVMVSENLARRYGYDVGTQITLPTPDGERTFAVASVAIDYTSDQGLIFLDRGTYTPVWHDTLVDTFELYLHPGADLEKTRRAIQTQLGAQYDLFVLSNAEFRHELVSLVEEVFGIVDALELVALIIALLGVLNAMLANVLDRIREIGVLRAIGALRRQVRKIVMVEAGVLGLASVIAGLITGLMLGAVLINSINAAQAGWWFPYLVPVLATARLALVIIGVAVLAGWYPARRAAAISVTEALEYE